MDIPGKRVSSGRLVRVDQRRRGRKWKIALGITAAVAVVVFVAVAVIYKNKWAHPYEAPQPQTRRNRDGGGRPPTAATAPKTAAAGTVRTLVVNSAKVPQRYGNALDTLQQFNLASGNQYRLDQMPRPKSYTRINRRCSSCPGFESPGGKPGQGAGR